MYIKWLMEVRSISGYETGLVERNLFIQRQDVAGVWGGGNNGRVEDCLHILLVHFPFTIR